MPVVLLWSAFSAGKVACLDKSNCPPNVLQAGQARKKHPLVVSSWKAVATDLSQPQWQKDLMAAGGHVSVYIYMCMAPVSSAHQEDAT